MTLAFSIRLQRLHWKRASKANHGLMLTSPLRPVHPGKDKANMGETSLPLLRPQELRYFYVKLSSPQTELGVKPVNTVYTTIMAGTLNLESKPYLHFIDSLFASNCTGQTFHCRIFRRYVEAVQELSICMAFAPEEEAEILEPFVEKLHLLRLLSSWECLDQADSVPVS
ncbi:hypothetical protein B296_00034063 [Ensete ventricosum]|uniref:Uncharacterized protein n=1 Tax=Ensete ventricosum TaxID=4639 RepID=A0A426ZFS5_ENSVE|nr:hypothetical protein B296_00034063 [Ensete ventricosum]